MPSARAASSLRASSSNRLVVELPWALTFSYGRALQHAAMTAWNGDAANVDKAQKILHLRAKCNGYAALGKYTADMEKAA